MMAYVHYIFHIWLMLGRSSVLVYAISAYNNIGMMLVFGKFLASLNYLRRPTCSLGSQM